MAPEDVIERWFAADGAQVSTGGPLVEVQIEDACHEILSPASGLLSILTGKTRMIEPGTLLGLITRWVSLPSMVKATPTLSSDVAAEA